MQASSTLGPASSDPGWESSSTPAISISTSTPPQNRQPIVYYYLLKYDCPHPARHAHLRLDQGWGLEVEGLGIRVEGLGLRVEG